MSRTSSGNDGDCLRFEGSQPDTVEYADRFWHSVQMAPAPESGLCCSEASQRLRRAPPGHQPVNIFHAGRATPPSLAKHLAVVAAEQELDVFTEIQRVKERQVQQRSLFRKQRMINQAKVVAAASDGKSSTQ